MAMAIPGFYSRELWFQPPFTWFILGAKKWFWLSFAIPMVLCVLSMKVSTSSLGRMLRLLAGAAVIKVGILPTIGPLLARQTMAQLTTTVGSDGVCIQSTPYTCGPAAAVTALKRVGVSATESDLAIAFGTSIFTGTPDDVAAQALRDRYGAHGLVVEHRYMNSLDEFRDWPSAMAVIRFSTFVDHFVAVLAVDDKMVTIGDPLSGRAHVPRQEFESIWRHVGILLRQR